jgi:hypothetical protein
MSKPNIIIVAGGATGAAQAIRNVLEEKGMNIQVVESIERRSPFDNEPIMITNPHLGMVELDVQLSQVDKHASKKQIKNLSRYHNRKK